MREPALDESCVASPEAGIEFVVVGGLALNASGIIRGAKDVDVSVSRRPQGTFVGLAAVTVAANGRVHKEKALLGSALTSLGSTASPPSTIYKVASHGSRRSWDHGLHLLR